MRFTPFINYIRYWRLNIIRLQSKIILGLMNSIGWNSSIQYFRSGHHLLDIQYLILLERYLENIVSYTNAARRRDIASWFRS